MKTLHLSTAARGGAAKSAIRIHKALLDSGAQSEILTASPPLGQIDSLSPIQPSYSWPIRKLKKLGLSAASMEAAGRHRNAISGRAYRGVRNFNAMHSDYRITDHPSYEKADIIHLHWTANFLHWPEFFSKNTKPVAWSLCDINPLSGGCHYPGDCRQFAQPEGCGTCPHLRGAKGQHYARKNFSTKQALIENARFPVHFVPPAEWMQGMVRDSTLFGEISKTTVLPHMSDETVYRPLPRDFCRKLLNLPDAEVCLLYIGDTGTHRKGFDLLLEAWGSIPDPSTQLILLGGIASFHTETVTADQRIIPLTGIQDERILAVLYNAVDAIIIPSHEENLALTFIDSQLCGTPAITFNIGGFQDHVVHRQNGLKVGEPSAENLANALQDFLKNPSQFDRQQIAADGLKRYGQKNLVPKYIDLYQSMLN